MEGSLIRAWEMIFLGCGWTSTLARGGTLATRWVREHQSMSHPTVGAANVSEPLT